MANPGKIASVVVRLVDKKRSLSADVVTISLRRTDQSFPEGPRVGMARFQGKHGSATGCEAGRQVAPQNLLKMGDGHFSHSAISSGNGPAPLVDPMQTVLGSTEMAPQMTKERRKDVRDWAIEVIKNRHDYTHTELHKAVFDLYHNPKQGDEALLYPLLEHEDNWVAAGAPYALCEVCGRSQELRDVVIHLARGDPRDVGNKQLQYTALCLIESWAKRGDELAFLETRGGTPNAGGANSAWRYSRLRERAGS